MKKIYLVLSVFSTFSYGKSYEVLGIQESTQELIALCPQETKILWNNWNIQCLSQLNSMPIQGVLSSLNNFISPKTICTDCKTWESLEETIKLNPIFSSNPKSIWPPVFESFVSIEKGFFWGVENKQITFVHWWEKNKNLDIFWSRTRHDPLYQMAGNDIAKWLMQKASITKVAYSSSEVAFELKPNQPISYLLDLQDVIKLEYQRDWNIKPIRAESDLISYEINIKKQEIPLIVEKMKERNLNIKVRVQGKSILYFD